MLFRSVTLQLSLPRGDLLISRPVHEVPTINVLLDPTKALCCVVFPGGSTRRHLTGEFLRPWQEKTRSKNTKKTQDTLLEKFGEIYSENFCNKRKATGLGGVGGGVQGPGVGPHRGLGWGRGRGPPLPPGPRLVLRPVSEFS